MSWPRKMALTLEAVAGLGCLALLLAPAPARPRAQVRAPRHSGVQVAVLAAEERSFGLWKGRDLGGGGPVSPGTRISVALAPSGDDTVQLFAASELELPREIALFPAAGRRRLQAPAPGRSLVFGAGEGALLIRVCPSGTPPLDLSTGQGLRELRSRAAEARSPAATRMRPTSDPGWLTRLPDGAPVEVPWRFLAGEGCVHAVIHLDQPDSTAPGKTP